jgi:hypothetical protein
MCISKQPAGKHVRQSVCLSVYDKMIEEYMSVNDCQEKMCLPTQKIQEEMCP